MNGTQSVNIFSSFLDDDMPEYKKEKKKEPEPEEYISLQDKKLKADTKKVDISNEKELNNLVERRMVQSFIESIGHSVRVNMVDFSRINSPELAAILGLPEMEMKINEFLSERIGLSLENVQRDIEKMNQDRMFL